MVFAVTYSLSYSCLHLLLSDYRAVSPGTYTDDCPLLLFVSPHGRSHLAMPHLSVRMDSEQIGYLLSSIHFLNSFATTAFCLGFPLPSPWHVSSWFPIVLSIFLQSILVF